MFHGKISIRIKIGSCTFSPDWLSYPADDVTKVTKGLQERTQLIEWDDSETCKER